MPEAMPRPVSVVEVSVPVLARLSPVSSTLSVSAPSFPLIVSSALIALTLPPAAGSTLPTLIVSLSAPAVTVVAPPIVCALTVSAPALVFSALACDGEGVAARSYFLLPRLQRSSAVFRDTAISRSRRGGQRPGIGQAVAGVVDVQRVGTVVAVDHQQCADGVDVAADRRRQASHVDRVSVSTSIDRGGAADRLHINGVAAPVGVQPRAAAVRPRDR